MDTKVCLRKRKTYSEEWTKHIPPERTVFTLMFSVADFSIHFKPSCEPVHLNVKQIGTGFIYRDLEVLNFSEITFKRLFPAGRDYNKGHESLLNFGRDGKFITRFQIHPVFIGCTQVVGIN